MKEDESTNGEFEGEKADYSEHYYADESSLEGEERSERETMESEYPRRQKRKNEVMGEAVLCRPLEVLVKDDRVEQAIRQLKNRLAREGVLRELKNRRHYFKPSELKRIKRREAERRRRKQVRQKQYIEK